MVQPPSKRLLTEANAASGFIAQPSPIAPDPAVTKRWLSSAFKHVTADPSPSSRYQLFGGQEPSIWYDNGKYQMLYTDGGGKVGYRFCSGDPLVAANWSSELVVVSHTATTAHSALFIEGTTLNLYYIDTSTKQVYLATSTLAAPTAWTDSPNSPLLNVLPGNGSATGNIFVVKNGATYYMFVESLSQDSLGADGTTNSWQMQIYTSTSPAGPFTQQLGGARLTSLRPNGVGSVSGAWITSENGEWVMYYHGGAWARYFPNDGYRATSTDLSSDSWTPLNQGGPFIKRAHAREVDQVADLSAVRGPDGQVYLFYAGNDNTPGFTSFQIMGTKLHPRLMEYVDGAWRGAERSTDARLPVNNPFTPRVIQNVPQIDPTGQATSGTWALSATPSGMYGNCRRTNTSAASGDSIAFDAILTPGTWKLTWLYGTGPDHGINTIDLAVGDNGSYFSHPGTVDAYAASPTPNNLVTKTFTVYGTEAMRARIRFLSNTKNAASSGYVISDQGWTLTRTDY